MERFKKLAIEFKGFVFGFVLSLVFVGSAVYAWNAVWHGTDWIDSGETIRAREIAETLEYLKRELDRLKDTDTDTIQRVYDMGSININGETNLGNDWNWVILEGTVISSDAAAAGGHIAKMPDGSVKVAISSATGGRAVFTASSQYKCLWNDNPDNIYQYLFCVKYDGNLFIKVGTGTSLNYVKIK